MSGISAIILAGGQGKRAGGQDKGLLIWQGKPMVQHIIERLTPQVDEILISCNRNLDIYQKYALPLVSDELGGYQGPLSGLISTHKACKFELVLTVPCDCPVIPLDLAEKLQNNLLSAQITVAHDGKNLQPLFFLARKNIIPSIKEYLAQGNRSVRGWFETTEFNTVRFNEGFLNLNELQTNQELK